MIALSSSIERGEVLHSAFSYELNGELYGSDEFGIIAVYFENNSYKGMYGGQKTAMKSENPSGISWDIYSQRYSEPMSFTLQVINKDGSNILPEQERALCKWLCHQEEYGWFFIQEKRYADIWLKVNFSNPQVWCVNDINGMQFTVTTDAPVAYSDELVEEMAVNDVSVSYPVFVYNDEDYPVYPGLEIRMRESGDLSIYNDADPTRIFRITGLDNGEVIKVSMDNGVFKLESSDASHDMWNSCNFDWLQLKDDMNYLHFSKKCDITMKYREYRRLIIF